jgi:hypothetical protein
VGQAAGQNFGRGAGREVEIQVLDDVVALPDGEDAAARRDQEFTDGGVVESMASARWRTSDRKNSWPMPAAVPSTTARRACKSSGTAEAADPSPEPVAARRAS